MNPRQTTALVSAPANATRSAGTSLVLAAAASLIAAAGCSTLTSYPLRVSHAQNAFMRGDYERAVRSIERSAPPRLDLLCYLCESGTFRHTMGDYRGSTRLFLRAVGVMEEFDRRAVISLRDSAAFAAAILLNDKAMPYRGEPYERVLLHTYLAMNFLLEKDLESARVEIRRAHNQQRIARKARLDLIERTKREAQKRRLNTGDITGRVHNVYADQRPLLRKAGNVYQNAFTYYLSSIVYELGGEIDDAYIDAKTVHALNPRFLPVQRDLLRYSRELELASDFERWHRRFGREFDYAVPGGHGEIVLLHQCGLAPVKREIKLPVPIPVEGHWHVVTVAVPKYSRRQNPVRYARLRVSGKSLGISQALTDIEATAVRNLWDHAPAIAMRQLLRAAGRVAAMEYAREKHGDRASIPLMIAGFVIEQADLRSWLSLPRDLQILRGSAPAGEHDMEIELLGYDVFRSVRLSHVPVRENAITLISLRSTGVLGTARYVVLEK